MDKDEKFTVLVTGFGPFNNHIVNASWEAVKELSKLFANSKEMEDVQMIAKEIPVSYENVAMDIPKLWEELKPIVVLHVGVSHKAQCLTVETCACNNGYVRPDVCNKCPDKCAMDSTTNILATDIDVKKLCGIINENADKTDCTACISHDAGRYLCEYIYYKSLQIAPKKTLFVHVPDFDKYSSEQTAKGLYDILCYIIRDVKEKEKEKENGEKCS